MIGHLSIFKNTLEFSSLLLIVFGENGGEQRKFKKVQDLILEKKTCKSHAQKSFQPALCRSGEYWKVRSYQPNAGSVCSCGFCNNCGL